MEWLIMSFTTYLLIGVLLLVVYFIFVENERSSGSFLGNKSSPKGVHMDLLEPPGPKPWPIVGSLHILGQYEVPYMAFADLARHYRSQVLKIKLGSVSCIVVNGLENIKEVLVAKGHHFDSRPNFSRYHQLFSGNKENSLAFSNWSNVQKMRREMLRAHTFPRSFTKKFNELNDTITSETSKLIDRISMSKGSAVALKPLLLHCCANIFSIYFCSRSFAFEDPEFKEMIKNFDGIFYEVNQGYAADFMPFLMPLHYRNMSRIAHWSSNIREFVEKNIIQNRLDTWSVELEENDYVDCLINHVKTDAKPSLSWDTALFALEDIVGGHSAIGNLLIKVFGYLGTRSHVQEYAQREIDQLQLDESDFIRLEHRKALPYVEAIVLEAIRLIASPIVPHVANRDSSICGYKVEKNTLVFLNNYDLNMAAKLWENPNEFMPERFVRNGKLFKSEHFLPFGIGRRMCMGYKMVQHLSFSIVANILKNFKVLPVKGETYTVPVGNLAMSEDTFTFRFEAR